MRTLVQTLQDRDRGHLRIIANLWGVEQPAGPTPTASKLLSEAMLEQAAHMAETLPEEARQVLHFLARHEGRLPVEELELRFGPLREMGPGRRDRESPWKSPASPLEVLWYRGLLARAFADSPSGPQEYGFIPRDLAERLPSVSPVTPTPLGRPAGEPRQPALADSSVVDDATTILAALRRGPWSVSDLTAKRREWLRGFLLQPDSLDLLLFLLQEAGLVVPKPQPDPIREFLEASRVAALTQLQQTWLGSMNWNDLAHVQTLRNPGPEWPNDSILSRRAALELLRTVPAGRWWSMSEFIAAAHIEHPHFLRPPGGFEAWYLQRAQDGAFLQGFAHWQAVEGEFLRHLITAPLHSLGALDLGAGPSQFRWSPLGSQLRDPEAQIELTETAGRATVRPDGRIQVARAADRSLRYQIARFCEWEAAARGTYTYRFTAESLRRAEDQGLTPAHAQRVLQEAAGGKAPPGILRALERWARDGMQAQLHARLILQVREPQLLDQLMASGSISRYIKDRLGPTSASLEPGDWPALRDAALRLGLLIDAPEEHST